MFKVQILPKPTTLTKKTTKEKTYLPITTKEANDSNNIKKTNDIKFFLNL
jgi:hypothetical protein